MTVSAIVTVTVGRGWYWHRDDRRCGPARDSAGSRAYESAAGLAAGPCHDFLAAPGPAAVLRRRRVNLSSESMDS